MQKGSLSDLTNMAWVLYPLVVIGFILVSLNYLLSGGFTDLGSLVTQKDKAVEEATLKTNLETKLNILKAADKKALNEDMELINTAVPTARSVWFLINELEYASSKTGSVLVSYQGYVGDIAQAKEKAKPDASEAPLQELILTAKYDATSMDKVGEILGILERLKPLANIRKISLDGYTGIEIVIEGAWAAPVKTSQEVDTPLPDYATLTKQIKERLKNFEDINDVVVMTEFEATDSGSLGGSN